MLDWCRCFETAEHYMHVGSSLALVLVFKRQIQQPMEPPAAFDGGPKMCEAQKMCLLCCGLEKKTTILMSDGDLPLQHSKVPSKFPYAGLARSFQK